MTELLRTERTAVGFLAPAFGFFLVGRRLRVDFEMLTHTTLSIKDSRTDGALSSPHIEQLKDFTRRCLCCDFVQSSKRTEHLNNLSCFFLRCCIICSDSAKGSPQTEHQKSFACSVLTRGSICSDSGKTEALNVFVLE
ncbi:hypothetical protein WMY93_000245 [Mugilogobius chulae]|uniref:Uncharacterized protein n=1 Tax=Mugilogobius chulae TaxID=88201 RepID=A0AAW0Q9G0_9GOBI